MSSWRTTATGVLMILGAVVAIGKPLLDNDPVTLPNWEAAYAAIIAGIGLILARDQKQHEKDLVGK